MIAIDNKEYKHIKLLLACVRKDLQAYLKDPSDFRCEYFQDVLSAVIEAEQLLKKGEMHE